jgi:hypothetical protein
MYSMYWKVSEVLKLLSYITIYSTSGQLMFLPYKWSIIQNIQNHRKKCHVYFFPMVFFFVKNVGFWKVALLLLLGEIQKV